MGDQVLLDFCRSAAGAIPPDTPLARMGGEEFAILLTGADTVRAHAQAEAVRRAILHHVGAGIPAYTCSVGVASTADPDCTLDALMLAADRALYAAKKDGRNRVKTAQVGDHKPQPIPPIPAIAAQSYAATPPV